MKQLLDNGALSGTIDLHNNKVNHQSRAALSASCPVILSSSQGSLHSINSGALREMLKCFSTPRHVPFSVAAAVVSVFDVLLFLTAPGCASETTA